MWCSDSSLHCIKRSDCWTGDTDDFQDLILNRTTTSSTVSKAGVANVVPSSSHHHWPLAILARDDGSRSPTTYVGKEDVAVSTIPILWNWLGSQLTLTGSNAAQWGLDHCFWHWMACRKYEIIKSIVSGQIYSEIQKLFPVIISETTIQCPDWHVHKSISKSTFWVPVGILIGHFHVQACKHCGRYHTSCFQSCEASTIFFIIVVRCKAACRSAMGNLWWTPSRSCWTPNSHNL